MEIKQRRHGLGLEGGGCGELREGRMVNERSGGHCNLIGWRWTGRDPEVEENWRRRVRGFGGWEKAPKF